MNTTTVTKLCIEKCGRRIPAEGQGTRCPQCREAFYNAMCLRRYLRAIECDADREAKPARVAIYAETIARGGRLFEDGGAE